MRDMLRIDSVDPDLCLTSRHIFLSTFWVRFLGCVWSSKASTYHDTGSLPHGAWPKYVFVCWWRPTSFPSMDTGQQQWLCGNWPQNPRTTKNHAVPTAQIARQCPVAHETGQKMAQLPRIPWIFGNQWNPWNPCVHLRLSLSLSPL